MEYTKVMYTCTIKNMDCVKGLQALPDASADCILADPPYNIGKDYGNNSTKTSMAEYGTWCSSWINESMRVLKPNGTLYIYGYAEILAYIQVQCCHTWHVRWLQWHYTNKTAPSCTFWQRSHESILVIWKSATLPYFNRDAVRVPYTKGFLKGAAGKKRKCTKGRFSKGDKETMYKAHERGALPRDVICFPALAGGAGKRERVKWHHTQKPESITTTLLKAITGAQDIPRVVVPFAGSGTECKVANDLGMHWVGFELNDDYVTRAMDRVRGVAREAS